MSHQSAENQLRNQLPLLIIIGIGLLIRLGASIYIGNEVDVLPGTFDQLSYNNLALRVMNGHGFSFDRDWWPLTAAGEPTAHWSYFYTLYLAVIYKLFGPNPLAARLFQAMLVGVLQPLLVYLIGRKVFNESVGLAAAALTVIYAYFVYYSATLMTESFYMTAILASLFLAIRLAETNGKEDRRLVFGLGLILGVTILLRQVFMLFIPFLLIWVFWARYRRFKRFPIQSIILVSAITVAFILPFTIFNYMRFDRFVLLNTNAGYAFFWANHPIYGTHFLPILPEEMGSYANLIPAELTHLDEAALDTALLSRGLGFVREDPIRYVLLSLSRIPAYFMFWPSAESGTISNIARVGSFGLLWPFMLYGLFYAVIRRAASSLVTSPAFLLILFITIYSLIHLLSWSLIRYRLPVDAVLLVFAGLAIWQLSKKLKLNQWRKWAFQGLES